MGMISKFIFQVIVTFEPCNFVVSLNIMCSSVCISFRSHIHYAYTTSIGVSTCKIAAKLHTHASIELVWNKANIVLNSRLLSIKIVYASILFAVVDCNSSQILCDKRNLLCIVFISTFY